MFGRATLFSALVFFILFGILGMKYFDFLEAKNQQEPSSLTSSQ